MAVGRKTEHLIALCTDHIQTLGADGTGRTQQSDFFRHHTFPLLIVEHRRNDHGHKGRNEHHTVKAVQNAAVPREDGAVILDAALALDHAANRSP